MSEGSAMRIVSDILAIIVIVVMYFVGGVLISVLTATNLIPAGNISNAMTNMITTYGQVGTLAGLVIIVILLADAVKQVRGMANGG